MRSSLAQLKYLLESTNDSDTTFLAKLESTGWLTHIHLILKGGLKVVEYLRRGYVFRSIQQLLKN